jgi:hypothetical protein
VSGVLTRLLKWILFHSIGSAANRGPVDVDADDVAGIQYAGVGGITATCRDAVMRLLQFGDRIDRATILTHNNHHCLLLRVNEGDLVAVKSGFGSGYAGEGPRGFSLIVQILMTFGVDIDEYDVEGDLLDRLDASALTRKDIEFLAQAQRVRPSKVYDYIEEVHQRAHDSGEILSEFSDVIPYSLLDKRLADLAIKFMEGPDSALMLGYRRLEDAVRKRIGSDEFGAKLFSQAFQGVNARLGWPEMGSGEVIGRMQLFTGAYMAHRNPRAHKEVSDSAGDLLSEFLLLNHLYCLEGSAVALSPSSCESPSVTNKKLS